MTALTSTMQNASDAAFRIAGSANGATVAIDNMAKMSGLGTVALRALSTAANMLIFFAIAKGIELAYKAIDNYIHRLDNAKKTLANTESELSSLKSEIEDTKNKIDKLQALDPSSLSITDKEDLQRLKDQNKELKIRQQYLEKQKLDEAKDVADYTKEKYNYKYSGSLDRTNIDRYKELYNQPKPTETVPDYLTGSYSMQPSMSYAPGIQVDEFGVQTNGLNEESEALANLIAKYEYYEEEKAKAIKNEDAEAIVKYNTKLEETEKRLQTNRTELQGFAYDLSVTGESSSELDDVNNKLKLIDNTLLTKGQNLVGFINSDDLKGNKEKLLALANSGKLTTEALTNNFSKVNDYLIENGLTLEDLISVFKTYKGELAATGELNKNSFIDSLSILPTNKSEEYIALLNSGKLNKSNISSFSDLNQLMKDTGTDAENAITSLNQFAEGFILSTDLISNFHKVNDLLKTTREEYNKTGQIGSSSLESITNIYPNLQTAVNEYVLGLISAGDVMNQLQLAYDDDANAFKSSMAYKMSDDTNFFVAIRDNNQTLFDNLNEAYGLDVENWKTMAQAKAEIDQLLIRNLSAAWSKYYNVVIESTTGLASLSGGVDYSHMGSHWVMPTGADPERVVEEQKAWSAAMKQVNTYNKIIRQLNDAANIPINVHNFDGIGSGKSGSGSQKQDTTKEIDWRDRELQLLEKKRSGLKESSSNSYIAYLGITNEEFNKAKEILSLQTSPTLHQFDELNKMASKAGMSIGEFYTLILQGTPSESREHYLSQILEVDKTLLEKYERTIQQYQAEYDQALSQISPEYKAKIEFGDMSIDSLPSDEAKKVEIAIAAHDRLTDMIKKQSDKEKQYIEDTIAPYENKSAEIENLNKQLKNQNSLIEKQIDYYKSAGEIVDSSYYEKLIRNTKEEIVNTNNLLANKQEELSRLLENPKVSKDSEEYVKLKSEINDTETELYALKKAQEDYNDQLKQIPIDTLATVISMYKDINDTISNWGSEIEASGKRLGSKYYQEMIFNGTTIIDQYKEQASLIKDLMGEYKAGSVRWNELYSQLQSVNSEMSSMVQNLHKWNEELLKMPMENINNYSSELQKVAVGLSSVKNEYETVISAVTGVINDEIQKINETKEAYETSINDQKKAIQDKLDLLDKQNEKLKLQTNLEQALYDLQVANTQKTERVIRNGEQVYESNTDNIRNAQNAVHDARLDMEKYNLQSQIDKLDEALESYNKKCEEQLENLNKQSEKWSEIVEKITQAQNEIKATEILGKDWKDKVIYGNDSGIYDMFKNMYQTNADQLNQYEEQINATNNIYSLLEEYIASYKNGTLSYDEAMNGMNALLKQLNQVMSASGNLQNIYDYLGSVNNTDANANDILNSIQKGLTDTASELMKSFEQYNKNSGIISEYTSSWQQLTDNVSSMLSVLKEVRDNLENGYDRDDDDDDNRAPFRKGSEGYVNSGPGAYKEGIEKGIVGAASKEDMETKLKLLGLKSLTPDEFPAILHNGEAVFNPKQQEMLLDNLSTAYGVKPDFPGHDKVLSGIILNNEIPPVQNFQFGDINIQECNNSDHLAQGILNGGLRSAMIQQSGKI